MVKQWEKYERSEKRKGTKRVGWLGTECSESFPEHYATIVVCGLWKQSRVRDVPVSKVGRREHIEAVSAGRSQPYDFFDLVARSPKSVALNIRQSFFISTPHPELFHFYTLLPFHPFLLVAGDQSLVAHSQTPMRSSDQFRPSTDRLKQSKITRFPLMFTT